MGLFTELDKVRVVRGNRDNMPREEVTLGNFEQILKYREGLNYDKILSQHFPYTSRYSLK